MVFHSNFWFVYIEPSNVSNTSKKHKRLSRTISQFETSHVTSTMVVRLWKQQLCCALQAWTQLSVKNRDQRFWNNCPWLYFHRSNVSNASVWTICCEKNVGSALATKTVPMKMSTWTPETQTNVSQNKLFRWLHVFWWWPCTPYCHMYGIFIYIYIYICVCVRKTLHMYRYWKDTYIYIFIYLFIRWIVKQIDLNCTYIIELIHIYIYNLFATHILREQFSMPICSPWGCRADEQCLLKAICYNDSLRKPRFWPCKLKMLRGFNLRAWDVIFTAKWFFTDKWFFTAKWFFHGQMAKWPSITFFAIKCIPRFYDVDST